MFKAPFFKDPISSFIYFLFYTLTICVYMCKTVLLQTEFYGYNFEVPCLILMQVFPRGNVCLPLFYQWLLTIKCFLKDAIDYVDEWLRISALRKNTVLPKELQEVVDIEIAALGTERIPSIYDACPLRCSSTKSTQGLLV